jgi:hypothetical protein
MAGHENRNTIVVVTTPVINLFDGIATRQDSAGFSDLI